MTVNFSYLVKSIDEGIHKGKFQINYTGDITSHISLKFEIPPGSSFPLKYFELQKLIKDELLFIEIDDDEIIGFDLSTSKIIRRGFSTTDRIFSIDFDSIKVKTNEVSGEPNYGKYFLTQNSLKILLEKSNLKSGRLTNLDFSTNFKTFKLDKCNFQFGIDFYGTNSESFEIKKYPFLEISFPKEESISRIFELKDVVLKLLSFALNDKVYDFKSQSRFEDMTVKEFRVNEELEFFDNPPNFELDTALRDKFLLFENLNQDNLLKDTNFFIKITDLFLLSKSIGKESKFMVLYSILERFKTVFGGKKKLEYSLESPKKKSNEAINEIMKSIGEYISENEREIFLDTKNISDSIANLKYLPMSLQFENFFNKFSIQFDSSTFEKVKRLRNDIMHGTKIVDEEDLENGNTYLRNLIFDLYLIFFTEKIVNP